MRFSQPLLMLQAGLVNVLSVRQQQGLGVGVVLIEGRQQFYQCTHKLYVCLTASVKND
jgi:hypothetical protein